MERSWLDFHWIAAIVALAVGCTSTPASPVVLEDGKSLWRRVETEHFVVESNASNDHATLRIASDCETLWHAFASVPILGMRPPNKKPLVVVLRDKGEYRYIAGDQTSALFIVDTVLGPLILLSASGRVFEQTAIKHELAHFVVSGSIATPPQWLQEGLAQVMETATYEARDSRVHLGNFTPGLVHFSSISLPAERFMGTWPSDTSLENLSTYYARSWLLVHHLIDVELQPFLNFFVRMRNGEDWQTAWSHEILLPRDRIDEALKHYHEQAKYGLWTVAAYVPDMDAMQVAAVAPSDALALRSVLHVYAPNPAREQAQKLAAAEQDFEAARKLDPAGARVQVIAASFKAAKK